MKMNTKCKWLKILSWIFFISVIGQALRHGFIYNHWWGSGALATGFVLGFLYIKIRKIKNDKRTYK